MRVLALVLTAASIVISVPALAQEPPPPEAPPPGMGAPPPPMPPPPAYAAPAPAAAPMDSGRFGGAGQIALAVDLPLANGAPQLAIIHESQSMGGPSATVFAIQPSLDYFVVPNLSIGGLIGIARQSLSASGQDLTSTVLSVAARFGYNIPASDLVSIWPRAGIEYTHASTDFYGQSTTQSFVALIAEAPILFHPAPHFFLGAGPFIATQLTNSASSGSVSMDQPKNTDVGLEAMIGGHFGGM